ncbi:MAG: hypothetical protein NTU41_13800, partial [Chloroflexi bacterium]|nr:hypothetical protein [Chloroflexota bacterium]
IAFFRQTHPPSPGGSEPGGINGCPIEHDRPDGPRLQAVGQGAVAGAKCRPPTRGVTEQLYCDQGQPRRPMTHVGIAPGKALLQ